MKVISFRDLIDLQPKPKKVKYDNTVFDYNLNYYSSCHCTLEELLDMRTMKEQNIEIIEDSKEELEEIDKIQYYYKNTYGNISQHKKSEIDIVDKINELITNQNKIVRELKVNK